MQTIVDTLARFGIPAKGREEKNYFKKPSVLLAVSILCAVDNPARDAALCGAMLSPVFGFTPDELLRIRKGQKGKPLYESLVAYAKEHPEFPKARDFLDALSRYRTLALTEPVERLLYRIYYETGLLSLAEKAGEGDNLWLLYEHARTSGEGFRGLGSFVRMMKNLLDANEEIDVPTRARASDDYVELATIHKSKGLSYPVVFLAGCGDPITNKDNRAPVIYAAGVGFAPFYRPKGTTGRVRTPVRHIVADAQFDKIRKEEMRLFYVALTRAEEELYLVGSFAGDAEGFAAKRSEFAARLTDRAAIEEKSSFLGWTLLTAGDTVTYEFFPQDALTVPEAAAPLAEKATTDLEKQAALAALLAKRFAADYDDGTPRGLPEKMSVSALYPALLDEETETVRLSLDGAPIAEGDDAPTEHAPKMPKFISGVDERLAAKRGIATHAFLQFADFRRLLTMGKEAERERLLLGKYLSPEDGDLVRMDEIEMFCKSKLAFRMVKAKKLYRELRFHVELPAEDFTRDPEMKKALAQRKLLVQGVMDCVMEEEDGTLTLLDYKTDRIPRAIRGDRAAVHDFLREKHARQLSYYREAVLRIFGRYPDKTEIYSLAEGDSFDVSPEA